MINIALMTALRIKGFAKASALADTIGLDEADIEAQLVRLVEAGHAAQTKLGAKLTPEGQVEADALSAKEHARISENEWDALYDDFHHLNGPFKQTIADWQIRGGVPNDHTDAAYDDAIRTLIAKTHDGITPILVKLAKVLPRLAHYQIRFENALAALQSGNNRMVAAPIIDSYHTVWFELHEDLIRLSGRTRAEEARAGRAV